MTDRFEAPTDLREALRRERLAAYHRLRGGYPVPLAGMLWWLGLAAAGFGGVRLGWWIPLAAVSSGLIFPMALGLARLTGCDFMKERIAVSDVLLPAFVAMLLFWPMAVAAWWTYPALFPLILAIGMSLHWPVIGWSYARTGLFTAHAVVRAVLSFGLWVWLPDGRLTLLPLAVALVYAVTVAAILIDTRPRPFPATS